MKGFILSAGKGTRLLPITNTVPKPLVKLGPLFQADYAYNTLNQIGIDQIGTNAHHLMAQVEHYAAEKKLSVFREPELLGTGGYLKNLGPFFNENMAVINCDCVIEGDDGWFNRLVSCHTTEQNMITLLLKKKTQRQNITGISTGGSKITNIGNGDLFFTGIQIVSPEVLPYIKTASIIPVFNALIEENKLGYSLFEGSWFDCGTLDGLLEVHSHMFSEANTLYNGSSIGKNCSIQHSVIYPGCKVEDNCSISHSIIYENTHIETGSVLNRVICHGSERTVY